MSAPPRQAAVTLGTRASALARAQTELVIGLLDGRLAGASSARRE